MRRGGGFFLFLALTRMEARVLTGQGLARFDGVGMGGRAPLDPGQAFQEEVFFSLRQFSIQET